MTQTAGDRTRGRRQPGVGGPGPQGRLHAALGHVSLLPQAAAWLPPTPQDGAGQRGWTRTQRDPDLPHTRAQNYESQLLPSEATHPTLGEADTASQVSPSAPGHPCPLAGAHRTSQRPGLGMSSQEGVHASPHYHPAHHGHCPPTAFTNSKGAEMPRLEASSRVGSARPDHCFQARPPPAQWRGQCARPPSAPPESSHFRFREN